MRIFKYFGCPLLIVLVGAIVLGQSPNNAQNAAHPNAPVVTARFIPDSVGIGDRFKLRVEVSKDIVQPLEFPTFGNNQFGEKMELVDIGDIDTVSREGRRVKIAREYTLTSFEEGKYVMPAFPILYFDKNIVDTLWSADSLRMEITTFEIDTLTQTIHDIKPLRRTPMRMGEISIYLVIILVVLLVIAGLIYILYRSNRNMPIFGKFRAPDLPHVVAIRALETMNNQKLWQNGKHKLYYTIFADVMRTYISSRYNIHAMEMTSPQIMNSLKEEDMPDKMRKNLAALLSLCDLVKFAKYIPEAQENEDAYLNAYYFVEETKLILEDAASADQNM